MNYKVLNYQQSIPWLTPNLVHSANHTLSTLKELPRRIPEFAPDLSNLDESYNNKILPDISKVTSSEMSLLQQEIEIIYRRIEGYQNFNVFDVGFTNGISTLPFILELLQQNQLNQYIPVTGNPQMNKHAITNLKAFSLMSVLPNFKTSSILHEPEMSSFRDEVVAVQGDREKTANLFVIMSSVLGNYINPQQILKNVYDSMGTGDYIAVVQGVYKTGSEDLLIADYTHMLTFMRDTQDIARVMNPDAQFKVFWDDQPDHQGIKISFNIDEPVLFGQSQFDTGEEITLMRSRRFTTHELEKLFTDTGFHTVSISFDSTENSALFFASK
jgi:uncharacterized SAM-dependent methyltransferase